MRRYLVPWLIAGILLGGCGGINPPNNTPVPSATATATLLPTDTPASTHTPVPSATITIVRIPTQDPDQPTSTFVPIPIIVDENGSTATSPAQNATPTTVRPGPGFLLVSISENKIFWGSCKHNKTTLTAIVEDEEEAFSVVIFMYVRAANRDDSTPWTSGNVMSDHRDGTYTYVIRGSDVEGHNHYKKSWIVFQLVITDIEGNEVGRTRIYDQSIALSPCE